MISSGDAILYYLISINVLTCIFFGVDKMMATSHTWRISEKTLWVLSILGGSIGGFAGMQLFRHKTQKLSFQLVMLAIMIIQLLIYALGMTYVF